MRFSTGLEGAGGIVFGGGAAIGQAAGFLGDGGIRFRGAAEWNSYSCAWRIPTADLGDCLLFDAPSTVGFGNACDPTVPYEAEIPNVAVDGTGGLIFAGAALQEGHLT
jgi:hypothetical protein